MQFIHHISALLHTVISLAVIDKPGSPRAATPLNCISTIIAPDQMDNNTSIFFTFSHELRLAIGQKVEESIANSLDNGCFTRAIGPADSGSAASKIQVDLAVAFDILQLNACNQHSDVAWPSQQISRQADK